jgi:hypothetical protein
MRRRQLDQPAAIRVDPPGWVSAARKNERVYLIGRDDRETKIAVGWRVRRGGDGVPHSA